MERAIVSEILSLESRIDKLNEISNKMLSSNGMCKTYALEAMEIIPDFNNNTPKAFYSKDITVSQYRASMESITESVWKFILECLAKIKKYIKSIINWLFSKKQEDKTKEVITFLEKNKDISKDNDNALNTLSEILSKAASQDKKSISNEDATGNFSKYSKCRSVDELVEIYIKTDGIDSQLAEMLDDRDPLLHDVCNRGAYYGVINRVKNGIAQLNKYFSNVKDNIDLVSDVISNDSLPVGKLLSISQYCVTNVKVSIIANSNNQLTFGDVGTAIATSRDSVISNKNISHGLTYSKLNSVFSGSVEALDYTNSLSILNKVGSYMTGLEESLSKLISSVESNTRIKNDSRVSGLVNKAISTIRADIVGGIKYIRELWHYFNTLLRMHRRLVSANNEVLKIISSDLKDVYGNIPKDLWDKYLDAKEKLTKTI